MKVAAFKKPKIFSHEPTTFPFQFYISSILYPDDPIRKRVEKNSSLDKYTFSYESFYFGGADLRIFPIAKMINGDYTIISYDGFKPEPMHPDIKLSRLRLSLNDLPFWIKAGIKDSWNIFYKYTSFHNLLMAMSGEYSCLNKEYADNILSDILGDANEDVVIKANEESIKGIRTELKKPNHKKIIQLISENPYLLHNPKFKDRLLERFIDILIQARYSTDRNKREKFKSLLLNLIPKNQGGKNPLPFDVRFDLARELMTKFAEFLSKRCREIIKNELKYLYIKDTAIYDYYDDLRQRTEDNKEFEISRIRDDLKLSLLILKPASFVDNLTKEALKISPKTLKRMKFRSR